MNGRRRREASLLAALLAVLLVAGSVAFAAGPDPDMVVTPTSLSFGSSCVGVPAPPKTLTISNEADGSNPNADLLVTATEGGSHQADFNATPSLPEQFNIAPGDSDTMTVRFTPTARGARTARINLDHNDPTAPPNDDPVQVTLSGTGLDRRIGVDTGTVAFGEQRVGTRSPSKTLTIRNPGQDAIQVSSLQRTGANRTDFVVTAPAVPFTIAAGDFRTVTIAFQPTGEGLRRGTLEISSNSCTQPKLNVTLVGSGVFPNVAVQPNPIDVGSSPVGKAGKPVAITVSNEGAAELKITAVQIIGADAADFVLTGLPPVPKILQPGESFVFNIRMKATAEGLRLATVNVLSDDPDGGTFAVAVRGTATPAVSPSPTASATASTTSTATASASEEPVPTVKPNDSLAVVLVVGGVLSAFVGLMLVRRFIRTPDDADF